MTPTIEKFKELLEEQGGFYTFEDILDCIHRGTMQSFADGDTWVITQVHEFPRKKVVEVAYVIGDMDTLKRMEAKVEKFAREIGADMLIATGRLGWQNKYFPGWKPVSHNYVRAL